MTHKPLALPLGLILATLLLATGCMTGRTTTTNRSAIEQALLSQSAEASIEAMDFSSLAGKTYLLKKDYCSATDCEYLLGTLQRKLLRSGLAAADDEKSTKTAANPANTPDLIIYPSVAHAAVDDSSLLIGFPEIPMAIPGVGAFTIPETAFFKHGTQKGCNRMVVFGKDAKTKRLAFSTEVVSSQKHYDRWVLLFVFSFRDTDLKAPHGSR